jgi:hypothetical protein
MPASLRATPAVALASPPVRRSAASVIFRGRGADSADVVKSEYSALRPEIVECRSHGASRRWRCRWKTVGQELPQPHLPTCDAECHASPSGRHRSAAGLECSCRWPAIRSRRVKGQPKQSRNRGKGAYDGKRHAPPPTPLVASKGWPPQSTAATPLSADESPRNAPAVAARLLQASGVRVGRVALVLRLHGIVRVRPHAASPR